MSAPSKMKAAVLHALKDLRIEECDLPIIGDDDVLIKIAYNGLCGTDASEFAKGSLMVPLEKAHPNSKHQGPTILGHEFVGTVISAGKNVSSMVGKRIACGAGVSCGECKRCKEGRTNLCSKYFTLGLSTHGGLAEFVAAPANICIEIPQSLSFESAALAQPLAVGIHGVRRAGVKNGDTIFLLGAGAIGAFVCVALRDKGVNIVAADISQDRLDVVEKLGVQKTILINPDATIQDLKDQFGLQADVVFETSGAPGAIAKAVSLTVMGGTTMLMGLNKTPQELIFSDPVLREITLQTTVAHVCFEDIPEALKLLGDPSVSQLLTGEIFSLDDTKLAFETLLSGESHGKILIGNG
jgi:2-desacetyl-2-hydroxyethyl bacteriochlorophyllide A dehydrogenase